MVKMLSKLAERANCSVDLIQSAMDKGKNISATRTRKEKMHCSMLRLFQWGIITVLIVYCFAGLNQQ